MFLLVALRGLFQRHNCFIDTWHRGLIENSHITFAFVRVDKTCKWICVKFRRAISLTAERAWGRWQKQSRCDKL